MTQLTRQSLCLWALIREYGWQKINWLTRSWKTAHSEMIQHNEQLCQIEKFETVSLLLTFGQRHWFVFCMSMTSRFALSAANALCVGPRP